MYDGCTSCYSHYIFATNGWSVQVQADVVGTLKGKIGLFNLDVFSSFLPVLVGLLNSKTER
jgi:hypothetical protein